MRSASELAKIAREFPDYDLATLPNVPESFEASPWHNDICPLWYDTANRLMLATDYADASLREFPEGSRYSLHLTEEIGTPLECLGSTDDWSEMEQWIRLAHTIVKLGIAFHPDTRGRDYIYYGTKKRIFSNAEAAQLDADVESVNDPYAFGMAVWRAHKLID